MLAHLNANPTNPSRVVILGAGGFVSGAAQRRLQAIGVPTLALSRQDLDLSHLDATTQLATYLRPDDSLLFVAAKAPVKSAAMLIDNIRIGKTLCDALSLVRVKHVVYISSDAVYADNPQPLTEDSCAQPNSLHGVMHLAREIMLANSFGGPLCLLRPTLIYGEDDPHNGYGPNRFQRLVKNGDDIVLFGDGEERRDHVWIEDVAEIIKMVLCRESVGTLNVATGTVTSFREIAELAVKKNRRSSLKSTPRVGPMPHNGYRPFDTRNIHASLGPYRFKLLSEWIEELFKTETKPHDE